MDKPDAEARREELLSRRSKLSPAQQALLQRRLGGGLKGAPDAAHIERVPRDGELPLTFREQHIFEGCLAESEDGSKLRSNMSRFYRLAGPFDEAAMEQAVADLARRHELLRTRFTRAGGQPSRLIEPSPPSAMTFVGLEHVPQERRLAAALEIVSEESERPFSLNGGWLWKVVLVRLAAEDHLLLLIIDHFISDNWSMSLLVRDLWVFYHARASGSPAPLAELPVQFADFAHWQRRFLQGAALDRLLSFWRQQLDGIGATPEVRLPFELPAPRRLPRSPAATISAVLPPSLGHALDSFARAQSATLQMTMFSSLLALLHLYTGRDDFGIDMISAKRHRPEVKEVVGLFSDKEVLRAGVHGGDTFTDLLSRVRDASLAVQEHSDLPNLMFPGEQMREFGGTFAPIFHFTMQGWESRQRGGGGPRAGAATPPALGVTPMGMPSNDKPVITIPGLSLVVEAGDDGLRLFLSYTIGLYDVEAVGRFLQHYR
ncbi:MAG TPA: condensation domain-containing protein, partial [Pyrinomonadaceae bacterium]